MYRIEDEKGNILSLGGETDKEGMTMIISNLVSFHQVLVTAPKNVPLYFSESIKNSLKIVMEDYIRRYTSLKINTTQEEKKDEIPT